MPRRVVNLGLLALTAALVTTGVLGWVVPLEPASPFFALHRVLGVALFGALGWKIAIARRSMRRRVPLGDRSIALGAGAAAALVASLALGLAWSAGALGPTSFGGYSAMNVHVFAGLALAALSAVHLVWRWETRPPLGRVLSRRTLLRLGGLSLGALVVTLVADAIEPLRRATGSKHAGSFTANAMPVTTWVLDAVPQLDAREWRLEVMGREIGYDELASLPRHEVSAVLDCTAGWWSEQRWAGVRLGDLLGDAPAREVRVVSVTGHAWTFPLAEVREMVLATHLGGEPLTAAHGYPARLVAPGRRGFQWIKWVARIELA